VTLSKSAKITVSVTERWAVDVAWICCDVSTMGDENELRLSGSEDTGRIRFGWLLAAALVAGFLSLSSLWVPLVLAAWSAHLARPLHRRLSSLVRGRNRSAGVLTVAGALIVLVPLVVLVLSLVGSTQDLLARLEQSAGWHDAVDRFLSGAQSTPTNDADAGGIVTLLQQYGASGVGAATTFLVERAQIFHWVLTYLPVQPDLTTRFSDAFFETGRGLLISFGLTALMQATILSIGYAAIGVPQPLVLGVLTLVVSFVPLLGTGLVWVPVTAGLLFVGRTEAGLWSLGIGCVVSLLDNVMRSALSHFAKLRLPSVVVLLSMFGGVSAFGPGGLLLGPLFVRLALEALKIAHEKRGYETPIPTPHDSLLPRPPGV
jgi:predicted PurR-regulated permease PerM